MALAGDHEKFVISENESCSHVVRPDWPTREKDIMCSMQAVIVCSNSECEALLCTSSGATNASEYFAKGATPITNNKST